MLGIIPFYAVTYFIANRFNRKNQRTLMEKSADLEAQLVESLNSVATIKRFGIEEFANLKTENRFVGLLRTIFYTGTRGLYIGNASWLITSIFTIILLWVGSGFVLDNQLTPGELLSFYSLIGYFTGPAAGLIGMNKTLQDALIAADRLFEIMDLERETTENKVTLTVDMLRSTQSNDIRFKEVSFRYGSRVTVFQKLNLLIPIGEITAVVGESGSGKSTLLSLLQNLYPLQEGNIYIGDYDIKYLDNASLRQWVSVVPQQIDLFAGTVIENIAMGEFEPDMKKLVFYCNLLGITDFIEKLPNGFQTMLGERGANLSGGQRQRLAIARALYRQPQILILDEATSALDSISERFVQQTIQLLRQEGITVILIAHRMSTIKNADKIIVLHEGKLMEEGTHQELLNTGGHYKTLWEQQNGNVVYV
jgi:ATP-binding cassette, subfamily C, bacteriocin exporter